MQIRLNFSGTTYQRLAQLPERIDLILQAAFRKGVLDIEAQSKKNFDKGDMLRNRSGTLRKSIYSNITGFLRGIVGSDLIYARIHQFGGYIYPRKKSYLYFRYKGFQIRTKQVIMPSRPFILPHEKRGEQRFLEIMEKETKRCLEKELS